MMDGLSERAEDIFCDALAVESEAERRDFVTGACAGDAELFETVQSMLASFSSGEQLFDEISPTVVSVVELSRNLEIRLGDPTADDEEIGRQIDNYTLLRKIGEGGGGNVYLAEQKKPVRRQVALKIIKLGMDTKGVIVRFEAERQALAMMDHPNIARVLNAGATKEGRPYFAMELVLGSRITTYCDENRLGIARRLELFIEVCHAIQHAHQKGIIHRDIKPSNVIVKQRDGVAVPTVIDFGIAKAISGQLLPDQTACTACGQVVGTPAYMSPEQADQVAPDIDVRSDIYSLGVLLYELLTGKTPFDQKELIRFGLEQMRCTIRQCEPLRPSQKLAGYSAVERGEVSDCRSEQPYRLRSLLDRDLDWIVMKALEKDRERRYQSADGFAEDLQRYLMHEPVTARPPSRLYGFQKLVRRNKVVFAAGALIAAVLMISSGVSTWLLIRERAARQRAQQAEEKTGTIQKVADNLRVSVEGQQQLAQALVLFRRGDMQQADAILDQLPEMQVSPGNATMYREIGDWHALHGRWKKAKDRFDVLVQINEFSGDESTMDDNRTAALLVEQGYLEDYERFRESMINRYAGTDIPNIAQRVLRECLLVAVNEESMRALNQYAHIISQSFEKAGETESGWQAYALGLWAYRRGDYEQCLYWCAQAGPEPRKSSFPTKALSVQFIRVCALYQRGQVEEAKALKEKTTGDMVDIFNGDSDASGIWTGYWFDRSYVRIHLREAEELLLGGVDGKGMNPEIVHKLSLALVFFHRDELENADAILDQVPVSQALKGNKYMFREIGDWHALNGRWEKAKARFYVLNRMNELTDVESTMDDNRTVALLAEQGWQEEYRAFRGSMIKRYAANDSPVVAHRVLRECLLMPAADEVMCALEPYARVIERSFEKADRTTQGWQAYALALWTYRQGDFEKSLYWCDRVDATPKKSYFPTKALSVMFIRVSALYQLGQDDEARHLLDQTRADMADFVRERSETSDVWEGYWFDWSCVRIHLREAEGVLGVFSK